MNETLVATCQMFLVPATLLFAAVGVAHTRGLKVLITLVGIATSSLWLYRIWYWTGLTVIDRRVALGLAGLYAAAWLFTLLTQLKALVSPGYDRR